MGKSGGAAPKKKATGSTYTGGAGKPKSIGVPKAGGASSAKVKELEGELGELRLTADTLEKERDFYFGKLRDIEVLLQSHQDASIPQVDMVMKILYATEDEKIEVSETGELTITGADGQVVTDEAPPAESGDADMEE